MIEDQVRLKLGRDLEKHSKKTKQKIWQDVSQALLSSRKIRPAVNVTEISRHSKAGSKIIVAGKVLGSGSIDHEVTVAAYSFSNSAKAKIVGSGGKCLSISDFMNSAKDAKGVVILG
ncbi:MAG: 50S ribosomal protein L18e [Nitrososphaerota archaeon]|nr:50S ribosomal protein L18e [Nitrososphaerota archaeon]